MPDGVPTCFPVHQPAAVLYGLLYASLPYLQLPTTGQTRLDPVDFKLHHYRIVSVKASRVENRRSDCSLPVDIRRGFRLATSVRFGLVLFPVPAHRTGQADFPHPALGKDTRGSV